MRRPRRIKRGLCPTCAYPVGDSPLCTECGKPVTPRSRAVVCKLRRSTMARNLLVIAKILPGLDAEIDAVVDRLAEVRDLFGLVVNARSGRGILYWGCWYDPWLMGDNLNPEDWRWKLAAKSVTGGVWRLSLNEGDWTSVQRDAGGKVQFHEQRWIAWHLSQAFQSFGACNDRAQLYYAREVLGASLTDAEITETR
jgi:hypothetical protein